MICAPGRLKPDRQIVRHAPARLGAISAVISCFSDVFWCFLILSNVFWFFLIVELYAWCEDFQRLTRSLFRTRTLLGADLRQFGPFTQLAIADLQNLFFSDALLDTTRFCENQRPLDPACKWDLASRAVSDGCWSWPTGSGDTVSKIKNKFSIFSWFFGIFHHKNWLRIPDLELNPSWNH